MTKVRWQKLAAAGLYASLAVSMSEIVLVSKTCPLCFSTAEGAISSRRAIAAEIESSTAGLPSLSSSSAQPAVQSLTQSVAQISETYPLGSGDVVAISIFNVPEYSGSQQVGADGALNLPAVGRVNVQGLTLQEAGSAIANAYRMELRYPQVTVVLENPRPLRVAIAGEVSNPGLYTLTPENGAQFPTVAQALQSAGGLTQAANLRKVELRRSAGLATEQSITLDLWQLLNNGDVQQDLALRDGDAIVISATTEVNIAETNRLSSSNLAANENQSMTVAVVGEVFRPGAYEFGASSEIKGRTTVTQVIKEAGGIKPSADIRKIQVRRLTRRGTEQVIDLDFWQLLHAGDISQDLVLQQGDTIVIPIAADNTPSELVQLAAANFSPEEIAVNVVGEVDSPGVLQVSPNTTLNQAVLAAGGFTQRATETVELIRLNSDGSVTQREIEVDLNAGVDSERNPMILNNDVVVVGRNGRARFSDSVGSALSPFAPLLAPLGLLFRLF